jgi:hypothetical protein
MCRKPSVDAVENRTIAGPCEESKPIPRACSPRLYRLSSSCIHIKKSDYILRPFFNGLLNGVVCSSRYVVPDADYWMIDVTTRYGIISCPTAPMFYSGGAEENHKYLIQDALSPGQNPRSSERAVEMPLGGPRPSAVMRQTLSRVAAVSSRALATWNIHTYIHTYIHTMCHCKLLSSL